MKLKAISTVQVAGKDGKVTEHKPGATFTVDEDVGQALIDARHAEKPAKEAAEEVADDTVAKDSTKDATKESTKA